MTSASDHVLARAIRFATKKHGEAVDKGGQPFVGHPLRVMARVSVELGPQGSPDAALAAAVLHDVLEDTGTDPLEMEAEVGAYVTGIVRVLTRDDEESYFDYIRRVAAARPVARVIKLADLADNLNPARRVPGLRLPERYERAVRILKGDE